MKLFVRNIGVTFLSLVTPLVFFKLITYYLSTAVLADYFQLKALAMIVYYLTSLRFPEVMYILRGKNRMSMNRLLNLQYSYSFLIVFIALVSLLISYNLFFFIFAFIAAYFIFLSNEIIESKVSIYRLFNRYNKMYLIKLFQLLKPVIFIIIVEYIDLFQIKNTIDIFMFEVIFSYSFIIIFVLLKVIKLRSIIINIKLLLKNLDVIKNTWLLSVAKMPYEAFPNYLLSFYVSDILYVQYNIARKIYGLIVVGKTSLIQVFNTISIDYKHNFNVYLKKFYSLMIPIEIFVLGIVFLSSDFVIKVISNKDYVSDTATSIILLMLSVSSGFILLYPFRQWIILNNLIEYNNKAIIGSIMLFILLTIVFVPLFSVYAASIIQPLGQLLPLIITFFILPKKYKKRIIEQISFVR